MQELQCRRSHCLSALTKAIRRKRIIALQMQEIPGANREKYQRFPTIERMHRQTPGKTI